MKQEQNNIIEIKNKKAEYQYFLLSQLVAGIVLTGTEIKSIREGKANLNDAYCTFINNELFVTNNIHSAHTAIIIQRETESYCSTNVN